ncbi:MAG: sensor histidine kinase [Phycisphaerae bacterium]
MTLATAPSPLSSREQEFTAIISSYNEVTERLKQAHDHLTLQVMRLREQLEEKNRELARKQRLASLGEMAAGVAHEIRNPLAGIQLFASMLEDDLSDRPSSQELAVKISHGVRSLDGIVGDILAFAGEVEGRLEPVDLWAVVEEVLELAGPQQKARAAVIHVEPARFRVRVQAHAVQLCRALLNLVFNALEAVDEGGQVWLDCQPAAGGGVGLTVADDGPGVPAELRQRVFDPFYTGRDSGTGLGLAIVHRIAESHGGGVRVSDRPGGGALFEMTLQAVDSAAQAAVA